MERISVKIVGQSGSGLLSIGEIITNSLNSLGFYIVAEREYPSLIKGGHACFSINISKEKIHSIAKKVDIMLAIDRPSLEAYFEELKDGGVLVHGYDKPAGIQEILDKLSERDVKVVYMDSRKTAYDNGGNLLMQNMVLIGMLWKALGLPYEIVKKEVENQFKSKPVLLKIDLDCLRAGYEEADAGGGSVDGGLLGAGGGAGDFGGFGSGGGAGGGLKKLKLILADGNEAIALGAIQAGVRFYYAYPMSPASSILTYMSEMAEKFGVIVKQVEDEITAAQMSLGSMFMGARAFTSTSGGGFDLMTETVSAAGILENPLVIVLAQRPGPGTGLPTWTMQGDLKLAINCSHGEFPRVVIAVSDPENAFSLIQHAFNYAEKYQIPVIVLTEKNICESKFSVENFGEGVIKIERGLVENSGTSRLRYKITKNGLSERWLPGSCENVYCANSDEHDESGASTEDPKMCEEMYKKRMRKLDLILDSLPEPEIFGDASGAKISFIGWGSSKNVMLDIVGIYKEKGISVNYLHYEFLYPLKALAAKKFFEENKNVHLIEGNFEGQFGKMISADTGEKFKGCPAPQDGGLLESHGHFVPKGRLLKYNGRPFFIEDVANYIDKNLK